MDKRHFDVKVFNPFAKSNQKLVLASCFTHHERQKKRDYKQRVLEIENGSFTPLVFSTTSGMGRLASIFYSRLAKMLSDKARLRDSNHFQQQWDGFIATSHSPFCNHPYCASEDQDQIKMSSPNFQFTGHWFGHQWITCCSLLNLHNIMDGTCQWLLLF